MKLTLAQGLRPRKLNLSGEAQSRGASVLALAIAAPEVAHGVAERVVPLRPARREAADLIAARPAVPRLGDELDFREQRILPDRFEEAALGLEAIGLARKDRAEVEAEPVDPHLAHPVAQASSATIWITRGWLRLSVFPVPVSLM